ncbi:MAG TPA: Calx-beta domain-containing protein [Pseudomonadales bacterium]|nr:Calx-beta domain-containing protein [Pseudomonadales bacterium]
MTFRRSLLAFACAQALLQLGGCGGGSTSHAEAEAYVGGNNNREAGNEQYGRSVQEQPGALTVSAGQVQQADSGVQVVLQGAASGGAEGGYRYQWTQIEGETVTLTNANQASVSFITPKVGQPSRLVFRLTATDSKGETASDTVAVVVSNLKPFARINSVSVSESSAVAQLLVTLSEVPVDPVVLDYQTVSLSAQAGQDFKAANGQIRFAAGQTQAQIGIEIIDDTQVEEAESFAVKLSAPQNGGIAIDTGIVTIQDNDQISGRALLGPVVNATVTVTDYFSGATLCTLQIPNSTDLSSAGTFLLPRECLSSNSAKLVTVSGGQDIDANDDGVLDAQPTPLARSFHAILPADLAGKNSFTVSALSEAAYLRSSVSQIADNAALVADLDRSAKALLTSSLDGNASVDASDLLFWNPQRDNGKFKKSADLLNLTTQSILRGFSSLEMTQEELAGRLLSDPLGEVRYDVNADYEYRPAPVAGNKASYLILGGEGESYLQFDVSAPNAMKVLGPKSLPNNAYRTDLYAANDFIVAAYGSSVDVVGTSDALPGFSLGEYYGMLDLAGDGKLALTNDDNTNFFIQTNQLSLKGLSAEQYGSLQLDLVPWSACPALPVGAENFVRSNISLLKVFNDHVAAFYYECSPYYSQPGYTATKTGLYWIDIANLNAPKLEKKIIFNSALLNVRDVAKNGNDLYVAADSSVVRVDLDAGKQAETLFTQATFDSDNRYRPTEVEAADNTLYTLFDDTFVDGTPGSFVVKSDVSNVSNIRQTGRIILQGAGECALHPTPATPYYSSPVPNNSLSMSLQNGILFMSLYYAVSGDYYSARNPGMLSFDANDVKGDNLFASQNAYFSLCSNNQAL